MHKCKTRNLSLGIGVFLILLLCVPVIIFCTFNLFNPEISLRDKGIDIAGLGVFGWALIYCLRRALAAEEIEIEFNEYNVIFHFSAAQEKEMTWESLKEQLLSGDVRLEPPPTALPGFLFVFQKQDKETPAISIPVYCFHSGYQELRQTMKENGIFEIVKSQSLP